MSLSGTPSHVQQPAVPAVERLEPTRTAAAIDLVLRVIGGVIAVVASALTALLELLFATLRVGGHLVGVSVLLAVAANLALGWFADRAVGRLWAVALPAAVWLVVMGVASVRTSEGDLLLAANNWVAVPMLFAGSIAFAVVAYRLILSPRR